jgi:hypothetical protein
LVGVASGPLITTVVGLASGGRVAVGSAGAVGATVGPSGGAVGISTGGSVGNTAGAVGEVKLHAAATSTNTKKTGRMRFINMRITSKSL